jgi:hypothetical protein
MVQENKDEATSSASTARDIGLSELIILHQLGPAGGAAAVKRIKAINKVSSLSF